MKRPRVVSICYAPTRALSNRVHVEQQYGEGEAVQVLEQRVAKLLGKPMAVFAPKGTIAQMSALRVWTDRRGVRTVALHP